MLNINKVKELEEKFLKEYKDAESMPNDLLDQSMKLANKYEKILTEIVSRNLIAWENSKDKREGMLPEIYLTNKHLYKALTGEEFVEYKAQKKYY